MRQWAPTPALDARAADYLASRGMRATWRDGGLWVLHHAREEVFEGFLIMVPDGAMLSVWAAAVDAYECTWMGICTISST